MGESRNISGTPRQGEKIKINSKTKKFILQKVYFKK